MNKSQTNFGKVKQINEDPKTERKKTFSLSLQPSVFLEFSEVVDEESFHMKNRKHTTHHVVNELMKKYVNDFKMGEKKK